MDIKAITKNGSHDFLSAVAREFWTVLTGIFKINKAAKPAKINAKPGLKNEKVCFIDMGIAKPLEPITNLPAIKSNMSRK